MLRAAYVIYIGIMQTTTQIHPVSLPSHTFKKLGNVTVFRTGRNPCLQHDDPDDLAVTLLKYFALKIALKIPPEECRTQVQSYG